MGRSGIMLSFLVLAIFISCDCSKIQTSLTAVEQAIGDLLDVLRDAVSSSVKPCSGCEDAADSDCVPHILAKLTDKVSVLKPKVSRLQSYVECDSPEPTCEQALKKSREPGFVVFDQIETGRNVIKFIAPNGNITLVESSEDIFSFYYNPFTDRLFTADTSKIRSSNMRFEDEELLAQDLDLTYGSSGMDFGDKISPGMTSFDVYMEPYGLTGDPFTDTLYFWDGHWDSNYKYSGDLWKVGMNGTGMKSLLHSTERIKSGTLDICKGIYYFGSENTMKSIDVKGHPQAIEGQIIAGDRRMDIDIEAQKIYHCDSVSVYVFDLGSKIDRVFVTLSFMGYCQELKVGNGFVYVTHQYGSDITKISTDDAQTKEIFKGVFSRLGKKIFTLI